MRIATLFLATAVTLVAGELYYPPTDESDWVRVDPAEAGWDSAGLQRLLDFCGERRSSHVVILLDGKILAERKWDPSRQKKSRAYRFGSIQGGQTSEDVASVQKSVTSALFGIAQYRGLIELDDPVEKHLGEGWSRGTPEQESAIQMRHLLSMTSGLTRRLEYEAEPGTKWAYNTTAYQLVMRILAKASGKSVHELTREWLAGKIGMHETKWSERTWMPGALGLITTARDLARFGLLMMAEGEWDGTPVLPDKEYIRQSTSASQKMNPAYGWLWWLNGAERLRPNGGMFRELAPAAPDDMYAALGDLDRKLYVAPSLGVVATRIGDSARAPGRPEFDAEFWRLLTAAAPR